MPKQNPIIPTVGVIVLKNEQVLLVKHTESSGHLTGVYGLPAGRVEIGELNTDAALRELYEETGLKASQSDLVKLPQSYNATLQRKNGVKSFSFVVYLCKNYSGEIKAGEEAIPEWIDLRSLDELNVLPNVKDAIMQAQPLTREEM